MSSRSAKVMFVLYFLMDLVHFSLSFGFLMVFSLNLKSKLVG